ncbi:MAG: glycosyltransferase family 2 protein, partial [bacterium]
DDLSKDSTFNKAECLSYEDNRIKVIKGKELPDDWLGKNWACKQLSEIASGDYLLFIDADVSLENNAIESALFEIENTDSDMLSVFPDQIMKTFGEKITVPIINWLMISFLPVVNVRKSSDKFYAAANGQFMLWRKEVYFQSGGHEIVKDKIVEDIELARLLKIIKYKINLLLPGKLVSCRMYNSFNEGVNGFTKNFFPASGIKGWQFILILLVIAFVYLFPLIAVFNNTFYLSTIFLIILQRLLVSILSNQNIFVNIVFYPLQMITMFYIGIKSIIAINGSGVYWKDRKL